MSADWMSQKLLHVPLDLVHPVGVLAGVPEEGVGIPGLEQQRLEGGDGVGEPVEQEEQRGERDLEGTREEVLDERRVVVASRGDDHAARVGEVADPHAPGELAQLGSAGKVGLLLLRFAERGTGEVVLLLLVLTRGDGQGGGETYHEQDVPSHMRISIRIWMKRDTAEPTVRHERSQCRPRYGQGQGWT